MSRRYPTRERLEQMSKEEAIDTLSQLFIFTPAENKIHFILEHFDDIKDYVPRDYLVGNFLSAFTGNGDVDGVKSLLPLINPITPGEYREVLEDMEIAKQHNRMTSNQYSDIARLLKPEIKQVNLASPSELSNMTQEDIEANIKGAFVAAGANPNDQLRFIAENKNLLQHYLEPGPLVYLLMPGLIASGNIKGIKEILFIRGQPVSPALWKLLKNEIIEAIEAGKITEIQSEEMVKLLEPTLTDILKYGSTAEFERALKRKFLTLNRADMMNLFIQAGQIQGNEERQKEYVIGQHFQPYYTHLTKNEVEIIKNQSHMTEADIRRYLKEAIIPISAGYADYVIYTDILEYGKLLPGFLAKFKDVIIKYLSTGRLVELIRRLYFRFGREGRDKAEQLISLLLAIFPITSFDIDEILRQVQEENDYMHPQLLPLTKKILQEKFPEAYKNSSYVSGALINACSSKIDFATLGEMDDNLNDVVSFILPKTSVVECLGLESWYQTIKTDFINPAELTADNPDLAGLSQLYLWNTKEDTPITYAPVYKLPLSNTKIQSSEFLLRLFRAYQLEEIGVLPIGSWNGVISAEVGALHGSQEKIYAAKPVHWRDYVNFIESKGKVPIPNNTKFGEAAFLPQEEDFNTEALELAFDDIVPAMITFTRNGGCCFFELSGKRISAHEYTIPSGSTTR